MGGLFLAALACAVIGAAIGIGHFWMALPSPEASQAVISATGRRDAAEAPPAIDDGAWTDADLKDCKAEAIAAAEVASKRKLAAISADQVGVGGPDPAMVERSTYLLCGASRKPLHLCDDYWRGWFIEAIRAYAIEFRQVSSSAYWTKVEVADQARRDAAANGEAWETISAGLDQTTREVAAMHEDIVAAFRALIADDIVAADDFGAFLGTGIPPDIGAMIGDTRAVRQLCG